MAEAEVKAAKTGEIDLSNVPKVTPEMVNQAAPQIRQRIEIVVKTGNNIIFDIINGVEAAKFVDSYQALLERKAIVARWAIGGELYAIPMENIVMLKMSRPSPQEMMNAGA